MPAVLEILAVATIWLKKTTSLAKNVPYGTSIILTNCMVLQISPHR